MIGLIWYFFSVYYTFAYWGFIWGLISFVLPFAPIIDLAKLLIAIHQ